MQGGKLSYTCLGLPIGRNSRSKRFWALVIDKVERRVAGWMRNFLSLSGRLTLINSVLANIPFYFKPLFEMPKGVGGSF